MEMPGKRSTYSLLTQNPNHPEELLQQQSKFTPHFESLSAEKNKPKPERGFDWPMIGSDGDHRSAGFAGRAGPGSLFPSIGLQRQSSGSSFGESSMSGEFHLPTTSSPSVSLSANDMWRNGGGGGGLVKEVEGGGSSCLKSWAQKTEESYQLQLALALRLSSEASCADDPNLFGPAGDDSSSCIGSPRSCAQSSSHRFWVNGCLSYHDKVPDGFYLIHGMDPYVWTVCMDLQENGRVPSIESLKAVAYNDQSVEAVLIDKQGDSGLKELQYKVIGLSRSCSSTEEAVEQLAKLVSIRMGGSALSEEGDLVTQWKDCCKTLKDCFGSIVLPIGSLSVGLCGHRALLFKVLADTIDLPCRIARGCKYCRRDDASSCLVRFRVESVDREFFVDLIGRPGFLCEPDSLLNGPSSIAISSPLRLPKFKSVEITENIGSLAKQCLLDCHSLNFVSDDASAGIIVGQEDATDPSSSKYMHGKQEDFVEAPVQLKPNHPVEHRDIHPISALPDPRVDRNKEFRVIHSGPSISNNEQAVDVDDLDIPWEDLVLKERIGAGSFGTVHRADWHGSDVAVKILMDQDFHPARVKEFLREVAIMKRMRHPNIVLFMGAVTCPPNLSIVTEYLARGSLYGLLHRRGPREILDERRRLNMAIDVARGMNYLHRRNPPIVHRDLKSPNLLVDKKWTVKICDFGLSRLKANTFLSSKSAAGTPEWMAPEVLRDEPSNEKSDVYSFGVILWELMTMQQPWNSLNPAQVVAAVGFKSRRLEIPSDVNPQVASIIESCWADEPWRRPSFASIMESLKSLIKPPAAAPS